MPRRSEGKAHASLRRGKGRNGLRARDGVQVGDLSRMQSAELTSQTAVAGRMAPGFIRALPVQSSTTPQTKRPIATFSTVYTPTATSSPDHPHQHHPPTELRRLETPLAPSGERRTSSCDAEPHVHRPDPTIAYLHLEMAPVRCNCTVYVNRRRAAPR